MKSRKFKSFLFLVVMLTAVTFSCDDSMPEPIYGSKPTEAFTATQSPGDIFTWSFTNNSSGAVSYSWNFGDGNGSSDANPSHTYSGAGSFTVTLTATAAGTSNALGWRGTASQSVQIDLPTYETADVTFSVDMSNAGLTSSDVVKLTGSFEGWSGPNSSYVMTDDDSDGVYEITASLETNTLHQYKFIKNDWGGQEQFTADDECAITTDNTYYNRHITPSNLEETQTIATACFDSCDDCINYASMLQGTWRLDGYRVGDSKDSGGWWSWDGNGRDCHKDDTYTFTAAGGFEIDHGTETWLETWQGVGGDQCGAPVAPHVNSTSHTYSVSGTMFTVTGDGAYIGLAKAHNGGEDGNSGGAITYEILEISDTNAKITLDYCGGGCFWTYDLVKQ